MQQIRNSIEVLTPLTYSISFTIHKLHAAVDIVALK